MAQDDDFATIMKFFSMSQEERAEHFPEVFEQSAAFFERFNYIMKEGTLDEKRRMLEELQELQRVVQEETAKLSDTTGLSEEELKAFAENQSNFSEDQWNMIQSTKGRIEKNAGEVSNLLKFDESQGNGAKPKKGKKPKKPGWIKS